MRPPDTPLDILVVAPHPDDAEISVGGALLRSRQDGLRVGVLDLTDGEPTPHGTPALRAHETAQSTSVLQLDWRENLNLPNRSLTNTLDARRALASVLRLTCPRILLAPYWQDAHPDHVVASQLCDDARFWAKLTRSDMPGDPHWIPHVYYFWSIHLRIHPKPAFVLDITDVLERKMQAIDAYQSQMIAGRSTDFPTVLDDIRDRARYWGWTIGTAYGEPFGSREEIGLSSFSHLG
ncbi:MAG: bacillithiol biosynthesis deacetylase BshB1 [Planctomycetaceae bacterium]